MPQILGVDCFYVPASYSCNSGALLRGWGSNEACGVNRYVQRCVVLCEFIQTITICQEILLPLFGLKYFFFNNCQFD